MPLVHMKPFVERQKKNAVDAAVIVEAVLRLNMHYIEAKSAKHQRRAFAFRGHRYFVGQCTQCLARPLQYGNGIAKRPHWMAVSMPLSLSRVY
jgi:hypothetical protein